MAVVTRLLTRVANSRRPAGPRSGKIDPLWGEKARPLKPWTNARPVSLLGLVLQGAGGRRVADVQAGQGGDPGAAVLRLLKACRGSPHRGAIQSFQAFCHSKALPDPHAGSGIQPGRMPDLASRDALGAQRYQPEPREPRRLQHGPHGPVPSAHGPGHGGRNGHDAQQEGREQPQFRAQI